MEGGGGTNAIGDLEQRHIIHGLEHYIGVSEICGVGAGLVGVRLGR